MKIHSRGVEFINTIPKRQYIQRESLIQGKIIKKYEAEGYLVVKLIQTNKNGIPDLMLLKGGKVFFIEVKSEIGKLSPLQEYRHKELSKYGFETKILSNAS